MKLISILILTMAFWVVGDTPVISWKTDTIHDFGDLLQGEPQSFVFEFKNISEQPIIIESVRSTCGCTAPDWDNTPIEADSIGQLTVTYDAKKSGYFNKKVKVYFSGQRKAEKIYIEGFVE